MSAGFKGFFDLLLGEAKPVGYQGLHVNLAAAYKLKTQGPRVRVPKYSNNVDLPGNQNFG